MAVISENIEIAKGIFKMCLRGAPLGEAGQFLMLKQPDSLDPFLARPLSYCDVDKNSGTVTLVYQTIGKGTKAFSKLKQGSLMQAVGPCGRGFPLVSGNAVLIGGGIGTAPLLLLAHALRESQPKRHIKVYLGFREEAYLIKEFNQYADAVNVDIGGIITDDVDFSQTATYYACGPEPMLKAAALKAEKAGAELYISLEKNMACGVGACFGCTCKTKGGNKQICKDGPVFNALEVRDVL